MLPVEDVAKGVTRPPFTPTRYVSAAELIGPRVKQSVSPSGESEGCQLSSGSVTIGVLPPVGSTGLNE